MIKILSAEHKVLSGVLPHVKNLGKAAIVLAVGAVLCTACSSTPRGLAHKATRPIAEYAPMQQDLAVQQFALEVSQMADGQIMTFTQTPLGYGVQVTAQSEYVSALGEKCRKARAAVNGQSQLFTVCLQSDNTWRYVEPLADGAEVR